MDLFITEQELTFERPKRANMQLDENPDNWGRQVLVELYRALPQTSEYSPQVQFMKINKEQGTGFGVVVITNDTDTALSAVRPGSKAPKAFVPIVVKGHMLCPLDLMFTKNGRFLPLNEHRLREVLFRPEVFEMVTDDWGDTSLYNMFYPPGRSDNDFGSGVAQGGGGGGGGVTRIQGPGMKMSSQDYFMLGSVGPTALAPDVQRMSRAVETTPGLLKAAGGNGAFLNGLRVLSSAESAAVTSAGALMKTAADTAEPDVMQIGWSPANEAYWVKSASRSCFYARTPTFLSRGELLKMAGEDVVRKVDTEGTVTVAADEASPGMVDPRAEKWGVIEDAGIYKVRTPEGKDMAGWVLPNLLDPEGNLSPMAVFTNGAVASVQDQIVGSRLSTGADLPAGPPKGTGLFYCGSGLSGQVAATIPLAVVGAEGEMGGAKSYLVRTLSGQDTKIRLVPGLKALVARGGEYFAPDATLFMPLDDEKAVVLLSEPSELSKTSALDSRVRLWGDGDQFEVRFHGLPKLASLTPPQVGREEAVFLLCAAGLGAGSAHTKVSAASEGYAVDIPAKDVSLATDLYAEAQKLSAEDSRAVTALRQSLVKEASVLPDVMTVDAVLSLGFINSENVRMFSSRLPYLEKALHQIGELLLAGRLGLNEIPEYAAARCVRGLDDTIQGLKALMLRRVEESDR